MTDYQTCCKALISKCVQLVKNYDFQKPLLSQAKKLKIPSLIASVPFQFKESQPQKIGVRTIFAAENLRLSIYHLPQNMILKMHNHPEMYVMTYILKGNMNARTMTPVTHELYTQKNLSLKRKDVITIDSIKDNLHEFKGEKDGCTFLDILFPDYNEKQRQFKMFQSVKNENGLFKLKEIEYEDIPFIDL